MFCHGLPSSARRISCFRSRNTLPLPPPRMPADTHSAILAQALTGKSEGVATHWSNLLSLRDRASDSIINSFMLGNSDNSEAQFTQLSKNSQQDKAPGAHSGDQLKKRMLGLAFFPSIYHSSPSSHSCPLELLSQQTNCIQTLVSDSSF